MLTVILPVYNAENHLHETIESILDQTYRKFVVHAINDGSTDGSQKILEEWAKRDPRVIVFNQDNKGLVNTLNLALKNVKTKYFCRHDADDVSHVSRFQKQIEFLEKNPKIGLLGTTFTVSNGVRGDIQAVPLDHDWISLYFAYSNCFAHGSIMCRSTLLNRGFHYSTKPEHLYVEDFELWMRISKVARIANLPELLYVYRDNPDGVSAKNLKTQAQNASLLISDAIKGLVGKELIKRCVVKKHRNDPLPELRSQFLKNCLVNLKGNSAIPTMHRGWIRKQIAQLVKEAKS